ncbi:hypothetical protein CVT26_012893 [Gymnopilus dilepis]|uniref:Uncharacterized protein n=1 Tax=Gymnopilus dilepis TaxID=231916 RepID=A0A409X0C2_9AGAR|nr:hypothetical protein CVT26_012893 [Gymnopilus dilepis]
MPKDPKADRSTKDKNTTRVSSRTAPCQFCKKRVATRNIDQHQDSCSAKLQQEQDFLELAQDFRYEDVQPKQSPTLTMDEGSLKGLLGTMMPSDSRSMDIIPAPSPEPLDYDYGPAAPQPAWTPQVDDVKIEYHPRSTEDPVVDSEPWKPFRTRLDFEIAELMLGSHMNGAQSTTLLTLIKKAIAQPADFTLSSTDELEKFWTAARQTQGPGFEHKTVTTKYKDQEIEFQVSTRPTWSWIEDLLDDRNIVSLFRWHAEHRYRFNGSTWERFFDEPWSADDWWIIQSKLPDGASPVFIILYADKSCLSSFGTAKGYPVFARCANLPADMRNGTGTGGGRLVGWLPIVEEDSGESNKKGYVNFKRVVWHKSFYEILDSIRLHGKTGYVKTCGDNVSRWLWPIILILCADYEEQYEICYDIDSWSAWQGALSGVPPSGKNFKSKLCYRDSVARVTW